MKIGKKTALLCVDLQKMLTLPGGDNYYPTAGEMMPRVVEMIDRFREKDVLIVHIWTKYHNSSGVTASAKTVNPEMDGRVIKHQADSHELDDRIHVMPEDIVMRKFSYSAFLNTPLMEILQQNGIENVLVCGIKTNVCCRQTAIDAVSHNFKTYMIRDMLSTNTQEISDYHLDEINRYFAKVIDSAEVLRRLEAGEF